LTPVIYNATTLQQFGHKDFLPPDKAKALLSAATACLEEEEFTVNGIRIWGSPLQPVIPGKKWAFNRTPGELNQAWAKVSILRHA